MDSFDPADPTALRQAALVREKARALVELWAQAAALELGKLRGARLSAVREHWDRCGFFIFVEPLGNSWMGVDLGPVQPLTARFAAPASALTQAAAALAGEGFAPEGEELVARVPLRPGVPLADVARETFPALWHRWSRCRELAQA